MQADNPVPDTVVDSSPNTPTNSTDVPFRFSSGDANATFECSINDGREFGPDTPSGMGPTGMRERAQE